MIATEIRRTLALGVPVILAQVAQMSMSFVDTLMVGRLGIRPLAAGALGNSVFFTLMIICLGLLNSTSPMVSQAHGAGDRELVRQAVRQSFWLATILAAPAFIALVLSPRLLLWVGQEESIVDLTASYLWAISWGVLPFLWFGALRQLVEGLARPRVVTLITLFGVVLNVVANYVLMYGKLGFPALGLTGCGWASALVFWFICLTLLGFLHLDSDLRSYRFFSRLPKFEREVFGQLVSIGWPISVSHGLEAGLFATTAFLMGILGVQSLAAHQIALQCAAFTFMVPMGLSIATAVRVGQATGAGDLAGARRAGFAGIAVGAAFMMAAAVVFWTAPRLVVSFFIDVHLPENLQMAQTAVVLLGLAATFQVFDGIQVTAMGALRGLKDTRIPMTIALVAYWIIGLPTGYLMAFLLGWGAPGLWWGLVLGLGTASLLLSVRFWKKVA